jgi:hypothetical protein
MSSDYLMINLKCGMLDIQSLVYDTTKRAIHEQMTQSILLKTTKT